MRWKASSIALLALLVGLALGERFPDVDQHTGILVHRSVFTHGPLLPLLLFLLTSGIKAPVPIRMFALGFSVAVAVRLCFDLFPKAWHGYALIHVPAIGWTFPAISWAWIALSIICCLYLALRMVKNGVQGMALVFGAIGTFTYAGVYEDAVLGPLITMIAAASIGLVALLWRASPEDR